MICHGVLQFVVVAAFAVGAGGGCVRFVNYNSNNLAVVVGLDVDVGCVDGLLGVRGN